MDMMWIHKQVTNLQSGVLTRNLTDLTTNVNSREEAPRDGNGTEQDSVQSYTCEERLK